MLKIYIDKEENMKNILFKSTFLIFVLIIISFTSSYGIVIDHNCTYLDSIPMSWIDSVQANVKLHYAHTSHGGQLTTGINRIESANSDYDVSIGSKYLPDINNSLCIFDGQENATYITPELYWLTTTGMNNTRNVLNNNPTVNMSMWSWCCQLYHYTADSVEMYLDSIAQLESEFPEVTFVYMTCNAQSTGAEGVNRYLRNEQIRQYCITNNKILFDFADLDSWWYNPTTELWEHATDIYNSTEYPVEHSQFHGSQAAHTTYESCEQKGRAVWWMLSRYVGWTGLGISKISVNHFCMDFYLGNNYPNPFTSSTTIKYDIYRECDIELAIYDISGQIVKVLSKGKKLPGFYYEQWNGLDNNNRRVSKGVYFYRLKNSKGIQKIGIMTII